jgi:hypothetical protein
VERRRPRLRFLSRRFLISIICGKALFQSAFIRVIRGKLLFPDHGIIPRKIHRGRRKRDVRGRTITLEATWAKNIVAGSGAVEYNRHNY